MKKSASGQRFRDQYGRFCSAELKAELIYASRNKSSPLYKNEHIRMEYADGGRIGGAWYAFVDKVRQGKYEGYEEKRQKRKYKRSKASKHKPKGVKRIESDLVRQPATIVGPRGGQIEEKINYKGGLKTYVRWGYKLLTPDGRYEHTMRDAGVFKGSLSLSEALGLTAFYKIMTPYLDDMLNGELRPSDDSGIHYYQYREDDMGYRYIVEGTEQRINGPDSRLYDLFK
jgi:hypothetical protein